MTAETKYAIAFQIPVTFPASIYTFPPFTETEKASPSSVTDASVPSPVTAIVTFTSFSFFKSGAMISISQSVAHFITSPSALPPQKRCWVTPDRL